jgi:hypothetical protein
MTPIDSGIIISTSSVPINTHSSIHNNFDPYSNVLE